LYNYICTKEEAFKKKLVLWDGCVQKGDTVMFTTSNKFFDKCWCYCWTVIWHY